MSPFLPENLHWLALTLQKNPFWDFKAAPKMANLTLDDLEERIKKLEELQEIQESNDNSINQVNLTLNIIILFSR